MKWRQMDTKRIAYGEKECCNFKTECSEEQTIGFLKDERIS